jgi:hypothetical protein
VKTRLVSAISAGSGSKLLRRKKKKKKREREREREGRTSTLVHPGLEIAYFFELSGKWEGGEKETVYVRKTRKNPLSLLFLLLLFLSYCL